MAKLRARWLRIELAPGGRANGWDGMIAPMAETPSKPTSKTTTEPVARTEQTERRPANQRDGVSAGTERTRTREAKAPGMEGLPAEIPMRDGRIVPTPGDPRTEPVATAAESWVAGRVGPRTIAEDATAVTADPGKDGLDEVLPGAVLADTPEGTGPVFDVVDADPIGANLARIVQDQDAGIPLDAQGRRVDESGNVLPRAEQVGHVSR